MARMFIEFCPEGTAQAMHREDILSLSFLGPMSVTRASDLKFNEATQKWDIWVFDPVAGSFVPPTNPRACGFDSYEHARAAEVEWFEECRGLGVSPLSPEGEHILGTLDLWGRVRHN